jgi:excinuclease ABC subunit A
VPQKKEFIRLEGIRQNNLKGFDLNLPLGELTVVTGLSGAGKSSLVFETLHAEGQRRYVETFSPYTRQFMELLDRPQVDSVKNIPPSIAIQQSNTIKTSRSTVGTITELCDYFKVWFANAATLYDPVTGKAIRDDSPQSVWHDLLQSNPNKELLICFEIHKPEQLSWKEVLRSLNSQGYTKALRHSNSSKLRKIERIDAFLKNVSVLEPEDCLLIIQDRITKINSSSRARAIDGLDQAFHYGNGHITILDAKLKIISAFTRGLNSPISGKAFRPASPSLFSFNSPIGACPECRGFGRIIEINDQLVIPDTSLSIDGGAIRAFQGDVYSESLRDLQRASKRHKIRTHIPWSKLNAKELSFVLDGDPDYQEGANQWYGVRRFFTWLESKVYRMHVRVFLSKFRSYNTCPSCKGARLQPESLYWKWQEYTLPELYQKSVSELIPILEQQVKSSQNRKQQTEQDSALEGILMRLSFLRNVGLGYLSLDRSSRSLSGGETMRVNLTACLGSSLVDTLFVLDEPSVGLHARDINKLIQILRHLTDMGNTVVVVEHDESVMRAADTIIEIGPKPGTRGGKLCYQGNYKSILKSDTITGHYLSGKATIPTPNKRRNIAANASSRSHLPTLSVYGANKHNINDLTVHIPQQRFVCLSGVSGSGKSTLLNQVLYQNLLALKGLTVEDPAAIDDLDSSLPVSEVVLVDQSPVSKTPRSNPASYCKAWDEIRKCFAQLDAAQSAAMGPGHFSFNSGEGRCSACSGLGYERVEMQFVSDLFVPCEACSGKRFKPEVLEIEYKKRSIADILDLDIVDAVQLFNSHSKIIRALQPLIDVGLGYLKLGQPLNTLSGGESQRLKLVRYLGKLNTASTNTKSICPQSDLAHALILIDEPTTGLHRNDVKRLINVLQSLVDAGHSLIVIEHNLDVLKMADWIIEMGPEAGLSGGRIVAEGTPEKIAKSDCPTAVYLQDALNNKSTLLADTLHKTAPKKRSSSKDAGNTLRVRGAREHNLKNIDCTIRHKKMTVVTGVSGSGKSSLAFDIIFAEGQRRFMESMSAYARQFVEQMPRANVDELIGIAPTVAIEQRVTKGTRKSTVATITEVAQYLRLLFARIGVQHSPTTGVAVTTQTEPALAKRLRQLLKSYQASASTFKIGRRSLNALYLCAPLIRGRKGHHEPLANWARDHAYHLLRIDGQVIELSAFRRLDRYIEHDIDLVVGEIAPSTSIPNQTLSEALRLGKGSAFLMTPSGELLSWFSTKRTDPTTGEAFPELDPKHFSWNSPRGWCPTCRGYGRLYDWMAKEEESVFDRMDDFEDGDICPDCRGARLNHVSCAVRLPLKNTQAVTQVLHQQGIMTTCSICLPDLLKLTPSELLQILSAIRTTSRSHPVVDELLPEIQERMRFMDSVGLGYLQLNRATATLSGGEAQRIRLAAQLGSNLSGVLYVLDEPSIGLHARDNEALIQMLEQLRERGNTLVVVEHNEVTMRHADSIIDLGPAAGIHGGEIVAQGTLSQLKKSASSVTGRYLRQSMQHPLRSSYRDLPPVWSARKKLSNRQWITLQGAALRNLKGFDLHIPKQRLSVICGVSGAGKSTLIRDLLKPLVETAIQKKSSKLTTKTAELEHQGDSPSFKAIHHADDPRKVIEVDQSPIGKTPRSTPATYIGAFDIIRQIFAGLPEARARGYTASRFSFNTKGGRCETCKGAGRVKLEMNFMPDTYVTCEDCNGRRYSNEIDDLRWNGRSIADVLAMSFEEAAEFFSFHTQLSHLMQLMVETGLGYITLGQYSPTLSGGEAQRMKLVSELAKGQPTYKERQYNLGQGNLYLLEEPTIGLHLSDVERLIKLLHRLVNKGHTVVVIEHHLDVIADADYLVEIGPEGGEAGGQLLYQGPVNELSKCLKSVTAAYL